MSAPPITPEILLKAYSIGAFPMAESREDDRIYWLAPERRGILPLDRFHISRSLAKEIRRERYEIKFDSDFAAVVTGCADRPETWINAEIFSLYQSLFEMGVAHSIEIWDGPHLVGGSYGVAMGAAYFGESMFSRRKNASKIALAYLVDRLRAGGFLLFDTQFTTPHLATLGGVEIARDLYHRQLVNALVTPANFLGHPPSGASAAGILQRSTQTS